MTHRLIFVLLLALAMIPASSARAADDTPATTQSAADATLQVQSVRITRGGSNNNEMNRRFGGRYYNDGNTGVQLTLLMTLAGESTVLPLSRDALNIDTFVDDTYANLIAGSNENRYASQAPVVSNDGRQVMITIGTSRAPAEDAGRVFIRGSILARMSRGAPIVSTGTLALRPSESTQVGPYKATLRSISESGQYVSLGFSVTGDTTRVRQVRVLSKDGKRLNNEDNQQRFNDQGEGQPVQLHVNIPPAQEEVTLELSHVEKLETVRIPFEAQVDIGVTKAGPIQSIKPADAKGGGAGRGGAVRERPWPPPPLGTGNAGGIEFPRRRIAFDPTGPAAGGDATTKPAEKLKLNNAAVDLFALTVAKPSPEESKDTKWNNPPAPMFRATGYTVAKLMLSTPDAAILSIPPDGVAVERYEDDKNKLDTTVYRPQGYPNYPAYAGANTALISGDGQQALVNVSMAAAPTPGATRCTLGGTMKARVARGERTDSSKPVALERDQTVTVGPAEIRFAYLRQQPPQTPGYSNRWSFELALQLSGKVDRVRSIELIDPATNQPLVNRMIVPNFQDMRDAPTPFPFNFGFDQQPPEKVIVRVRHFAEAETVSVPFEVTTGIGL